MSFQLLSLLKLLLGVSRYIPIGKSLPVLIVEDNADDAELIAYYVQGCDAEAVTVSTVDAARALLKTQRFHMVFLDIKLGGGNGVEFAKHFVRPEFPRLPIVFITGNAQEITKLPPGRCWIYINKGNECGSLKEAIHDALATANGLNGHIPLAGVAVIVWLLMVLSVLFGFFLNHIAPLIKHLLAQ